MIDYEETMYVSLTDLYDVLEYFENNCRVDRYFMQDFKRMIDKNIQDGILIPEEDFQFGEWVSYDGDE